MYFFFLTPPPLRGVGQRLQKKEKQNYMEVFMTNIIFKELGYKIMNIAFQVHNNLGPGLLESAYEEDDNEKVLLQRIYLFRYRLEFQNVQLSYKEHFESPRNLIAVRNANIPFECQKVYPLVYKGDYISSYFA